MKIQITQLTTPLYLRALNSLAIFWDADLIASREFTPFNAIQWIISER